MLCCLLHIVQAYDCKGVLSDPGTNCYDAGVSNTELWNNLALCCFYASQHDMALGCFERAFAMADDTNLADVWYNVGQVAVGESLHQPIIYAAHG